ADPPAHLHADRGDLILPGPAGPLALHPDPDAALAHVGGHAELAQSADDPLLQSAHEGAHVAAAPVQVQHDIGHPLAGAVIGELTAPPRAVHREAAGLQQVIVLDDTPAV